MLTEILWSACDQPTTDRCEVGAYDTRQEAEAAADRKGFLWLAKTEYCVEGGHAKDCECDVCFDLPLTFFERRHRPCPREKAISAAATEKASLKGKDYDPRGNER